MANVYRGYVRAYQGSSKEHQKAFLEEQAKGLGMPFKCYVDMENLMVEIRSGDIVGVHSLGRLSKDPAELDRIIDEIHQRGATLQVGGRDYSLSSPADRLQIRMESAFHDFEKRHLSEKIKNGMKAAKSRNAWKTSKQNKKMLIHSV